LCAAAVSSWPAAAQTPACNDVPAFSPYLNGRSGERRASSQDVITRGVNALVAAARSKGVDPCIALTIAMAESGGDPAAIGHDENNRAAETCQAKLRRCHALHGGSGARNDDTPNRTAADLGLDWRFTHGLGIGQTTIGPSCRTEACGSATSAPSYRLSTGASLAPKDLVNLPGSVDAAIDEIKSKIDYARAHKPADLTDTPEIIAMLVFTKYGGHFPCLRAGGAGGATVGRMETWRRCNTRGADCIARWLINGGRRAGGVMPRELQNVRSSTDAAVVRYASDHHYLTNVRGEDGRHDSPHCAVYTANTRSPHAGGGTAARGSGGGASPRASDAGARPAQRGARTPSTH
jgi:hypothetical protein